MHFFPLFLFSFPPIIPHYIYLPTPHALLGAETFSLLLGIDIWILATISISSEYTRTSEIEARGKTVAMELKSPG